METTRIVKPMTRCSDAVKAARALNEESDRKGEAIDYYVIPYRRRFAVARRERRPAIEREEHDNDRRSGDQTKGGAHDE